MDHPPKRPPGMSTGDWVEAAIQQAMAEGKFDRIADAPDPMAGVDLDRDDDELWWLKKLLDREGLKPSDERYALKQAAWELRCGLVDITDEATLRARVREVNAAVERLNLSETSPMAGEVVGVDEEAAVVVWRRERIGRKR